MNSSFITALVLILLCAYLIHIFNTLVKLKNRHQNAFAQIEVQLKRRYDLIPNLVNTAKAYMKHERDALEAVIAARNQAATELQAAKQGGSHEVHALGLAEGQLSSALGRFNVVMEAYPELKANHTMLQLNEELSSTENKVSFARQAYNDAVTYYNEYRQSFPPVLFANAFGHRQDATLLEFADRAEIQNAPKVSFD